MGLVRHGHLDVLAVAGLCLLAWIGAAFHYTLHQHVHKIYNYHQQILALRVALILPVFSIFMYLTLSWPTASAVLIAFAGAAEGYGVYCYLALAITYCGGREAVIENIHSNKSTFCCWRCLCCDPSTCLWIIEIGILQLVFVRPIILLLYGLEQEAGDNSSTEAKMLNYLGSVLMLFAMLGLLHVYFMLHDNIQSMKGTEKILILKVLILFLMIQDLVLQSLLSAGAFDNTPDYGLDYSAESKETRIYAFIALVEFAVASIFVGSFFHPETLKDSGDRAEHGSLKLEVRPTYLDFVMDLLTLHRVFTPPPRLVEDLRTSLTSNTHL